MRPQAEARAVDHVLRLETCCRQRRGHALRCARLGEIESQHERARPALRGDLLGERLQPFFAPGDEHQFVTVLRKDPRERRATPAEAPVMTATDVP